MSLNTNLAALEASGLIHLAQVQPEIEYLFRHALMQEAAYTSLLKADRRILHRVVGEALERAYPDRLDELAPILGRHFAEAGEGEKAVKYLLRAGDRASEVYAYQEAIDAYEQAMPFLKAQGTAQRERAARTLMRLGLLYHTLFNFQRSRLAYEEGLALWQQAGEIQPGSPLPPAPHALRLPEADPPTLDPTLAGDVASVGIIDQLFSGLVELSQEMEIAPAVARTWEVLEGGRKYVFHLRDDVRWSDGTPVTAGDFEYAWKRVLNPATRSPAATYLYDVKGAKAFHSGQAPTPDSVGVRALDELTLVVELEGPAGYFLHLLATSATYPVPRHVVGAKGAAWTEVGNIVTNGPFRLEAWQPGQPLVLSRNSDYHGRFSGNVQRVEALLWTTEFSAAFEQYEADNLDICGLWGPVAERTRARQRHAGDYVSAPGAWTNYVGFDLRRPPFGDPRVRQAFVLAVNRETLAEVVLQGYLSPATGGFVPPGLPAHSAGIGLPYDPDRARWLLAEAGYPGGQGFPAVNALAARGDEPEIEYLSTQWRENLGVEIVWETLEWAMLLDRLTEAPPHLFRTGWVADYPDPDNFLRVALAQYYTQPWNEAYDNLVEGARRITNQAKRMEMYREADRILIESAAIMPLIYGRTHLLAKPWVSRYPISATQVLLCKDVVIEPH